MKTPADPDDFFSSTTIIAVIGYGRFGRLLTDILVHHTRCQILVITRQRPAQSTHHRITFGQWADLATANVIIPAVSISAFAEVIKKIVPFIQPAVLVIDVCSVKCWPVEVMVRHLPTTVSILATHPLFGPDSFAKNQGLQNLPIVLHPVRLTKPVYQTIKEWCLSLGLRVIEVSPEEHDTHAAFTQAYAFLIGQLTHRMHLPETPIDTWWYRLLFEQSKAITHDSDQLFLDIQTKNPYATLMRQRFVAELKKLLATIDPNYSTKL